jgi:glutamate-1-semialdehyde 2,1-aminomutase
LGKRLVLDKSKKAMAKANELIPGGTNSGARASLTRGTYEGFSVPMPAFMDRGEGSHLFDIDGNEYIDYNLGFGPAILGHSDPAVTRAVTAQLTRGSVYSANTETEIKLIEKLVKHIPSAEQIILANTGSEATTIALRLARAFTGKQKVLKFEGHYHGWHDWAMVGTAFSVVGTFAKGQGQKVFGSAGMAQSTFDDVIVIPWNDPEALEKTIKRHGNDIALCITEGYQSNWGVMPPEKGYLELMRKLTKQSEILFHIDEVITGFRLGLGGFQAYSVITPDISSFSKAMANGFPISAVASSKDVMESVATDQVYIAGTFNGNALSTTAALATVTELESYGSYKQIYDRGKKVMKGITDALADNGIPGVVQGPGPMWSVYFTDLDKISRTREVYSIPQYPHIKRSAVFFDGLIRRGVLLSPARYGRMYISFAHTEEDVRLTIEAAQEAMKEAKRVKS